MYVLCCLQWWCLHEPKVLSKKELKKGVKCPRRKQPFSDDLNGKDGAEKAARFLQWYVIEGHAGYEVSTLAPTNSNMHCCCCCCCSHVPWSEQWVGADSQVSSTTEIVRALEMTL